MKELLEIVLMSLAVWRVARLITGEEFVFGLARKLRLLCGVVEAEVTEVIETGHDSDGFTLEKDYTYYSPIPSHLQPTLLARGITCVWCMSFWLGLLFCALYLYNSTYALNLSLPLALSALAIGYNKVIGD